MLQFETQVNHLALQCQAFEPRSPLAASAAERLLFISYSRPPALDPLRIPYSAKASQTAGVSDFGC